VTAIERPTPAGSGLVTQAMRRARSARRIADSLRQYEGTAWRNASRVAVLFPLAALVFALTVLVIKARPAIIVNGWGFLTRATWNAGNGYSTTLTKVHGITIPTGASYGAGAIIAGTLIVSAIAVVIALPISVGAAFALTERMPRWLSQPLGFFIELLAGVPSVLFGLWGVLTFGPWLAHHVYPHVASVFPNVPVLRYFRGPTYAGEGLITTGLVLALMIVPIITATTRDLFSQVPPLPKEGGEALGMTEFEVARRVTVPWVRSGIIGATVLGLGRALGETIAVAMISGSALAALPSNIYGTFGTIAATIVNQLDSASSDGTGFAVATLAELGLILAVISVAVNLLARLVINRSSRLGAPLGRGV
jgi:phosphate transport system permease protein